MKIVLYVSTKFHNISRYSISFLKEQTLRYHFYYISKKLEKNNHKLCQMFKIIFILSCII